MSITCSCLHASEGFVYSGSFDGVIVSTSLISGVSVKLKGDNRNNVSGSIHNGKVVGVSLSGDMVASVGFDDTLRFSKNDVLQSSVSLTGQPSAACSPSSDVTVVTAAGGMSSEVKQKFANWTLVLCSNLCCHIW